MGSSGKLPSGHSPFAAAHSSTIRRKTMSLAMNPVADVFRALPLSVISLSPSRRSRTNAAI